MSSSNKLEDDWSRIGAWVDPSLISSALFAAELDAFMEKRMQNPIVGDKATKVKGVQKHLRDTKADALWGQSNAAVVTARWQQVHTVKRSKTQPLSSLVTLTSGGGGGAGSSTSASSGSVASTMASVASPAGDMFEQMRDYTTTSEEYLAAAGSLALHLDLSDEASNSPNDAYFRQSIAIVDCTRLVEGDVVLVPVDIYLKPTTCAVVIFAEPVVLSGNVNQWSAIPNRFSSFCQFVQTSLGIRPAARAIWHRAHANRHIERREREEVPRQGLPVHASSPSNQGRFRLARCNLPNHR